MLCISIAQLSLVENGPVTYVEIFKKFKKKDVLLKATDYYGRNCFHHAALAGNLLGLQLAVKLMPGDPIVNDHYGDALWKNGNKIQARYYWNYVLNLKKTEEDLREIIKKKLIIGL